MLYCVTISCGYYLICMQSLDKHANSYICGKNICAIAIVSTYVIIMLT